MSSENLFSSKKLIEEKERIEGEICDICSSSFSETTNYEITMSKLWGKIDELGNIAVKRRGKVI